MALQQSPTQKQGQQAEQQVCRFLRKQGLSHVISNYRCRLGEIDLVMRDRNYYVFVEVKYRKNNQYGGALASVHNTKQQRIIYAAQHYLQQHRLTDKVPCRFDVITVLPGMYEQDMVWIKDAFEGG